MSDFFVSLFSTIFVLAFLYASFRFAKWLLHHHSDLERSLNMTFLKIQIPKRESKDDLEKEQAQYSSSKDFKEILGVATHMFDSLHSIYTKDIKNYFTGQDFLSLEYAVLDGQIYFYIVVPGELTNLVEKQITAFYPDSYVEKVSDYNIFRPQSKYAAYAMELKKPYWYPFKSFSRLNSDPLNHLTNVLSKLGADDGAAIQIMIKPKKDGWQKKGRHKAKEMLNQKFHNENFN